MKYLKLFENMKEFHQEANNKYFVITKDEKYLLLTDTGLSRIDDVTPLNNPIHFLMVVKIGDYVYNDMFTSSYYYFDIERAESFLETGNLGVTEYAQQNMGEHNFHFFDPKPRGLTRSSLNILGKDVYTGKAKPMNLTKDDFKIVEYQSGFIRTKDYSNI